MTAELERNRLEREVIVLQERLETLERTMLDAGFAEVATDDQACCFSVAS